MSIRWTDRSSPRIFRSPNSRFYEDEPMRASEVYTTPVLAGLAEHGFNGIWLRGRLRELMNSAVLPQLNDPAADQRLASLRCVMDRGHRLGIGVYLFFNDPLALEDSDPFWQARPELAGEPRKEWDGRHVTSLCLSHPVTARYLEQATQSVMTALPGLAGVILITASEHHSHCWSHRSRVDLGDGYVFKSTEPMRCARCAAREPADLVAQITGAWRAAADRSNPTCRVIAWNWSWSMWYGDPQREVVDALPPGVDLLADWERGGQREWLGRTLPIDEYSLGYVGPSPRFVGSHDAAAAHGRRVLAKLQLNVTHEMASVPNLPLMTNLHAKLRGLYERGVGGFMGTWNFGASLTMNTFAVGLFGRDPRRYCDQGAFLEALADEYLGAHDVAGLTRAWQAFAEAFAIYPFSLRMLYFSPVNDGPAHPLSLQYRATPLGDSYLAHEFGDRIEDCLGDLPIQGVIESLARMAQRWREGLAHYEPALAGQGHDITAQHRREELGVARMIGIQLSSALSQFRFHHRRMQLMADRGWSGPCALPADPELLAIMRDEIDNVRAALPLLATDARLGYHQEGQVAMYDGVQVQAKIRAMEAELDAVAFVGAARSDSL
jgi:hypothetical protein